jgi:glycosyltransferase involved in cell wall biosynthesis
MVCGVEGIHLAYLSRTPYLIWPHGGDIRAAAGYPRIRFAGLAATARRIADRKCFATAFENANWVASHDPTAVGGGFCDSTPALGGKPLVHLPIPIPVRRRIGREERRQRRRELFLRHGVHLDPDTITLFVPSRIDFSWKGHDRLLAAASSVAGVQFLLTGWGGDQEAARALVRDTGLAGRVAQLTYAVSKPALFELMDAADAVVDQFVMGTYGTAAVEAMAGGTPVVMYIENSRFAKLGWAAPPVINCASVNEIEAALAAIASGTLDLEAWGARAQMWCERIHNPTKVALCVDTMARHATQVRRTPK